MTLNKKEVANRIKNIRLGLGLTMEKFGKRLDTSKGAVNNWEKEKSLPNNERLKIIAELGNVTVDELLYGNQQEYTYNVLINELDNKGKFWNTIKEYINSFYGLDENDEVHDLEMRLITDNFEAIYSKILNYQPFVNPFNKKPEDRNIADLTFIANNPSYKDKETENLDISDGLYGKDELIVKVAERHFYALLLNGVNTFEGYYKKLKFNLGKSAPYAIYHASNLDIDRSTKRYEKRGFDKETAQKKAIDTYYVSKIDKPYREFLEEIEAIHQEYVENKDKLL